MVKFFRVKQKARGLARQQKFDEALAEYRNAIARAEADRDLPALRNLYNAAGDASLQKNDTAAAVEFFEKAVDSYLEEGLHDNAIALCHKILRHVPTKVEIYARLGRVYGDKGLRNESIQNWLEYAERREKAGDLAGVTLALREVLGLSPESDAVRQQLVEVLMLQQDTPGALHELRELRRRAEGAGEAGRAREIADRIAALGGGDTPTPPLSADTPPIPEFGAPPPSSADGLGMERFEPVGGERPSATRRPAEPVPGLDAGFGFSAPAPTLEPPGGPPASGEAAAGPSTPIWTLPGFTAPDAAPAEAPEQPPAEIGRVPFVAVEERIQRAEARLASAPDEADERLYLSELYQEAGALDLARSAAAQAGADFLAAGRHEAAYRAYRRVVTLAPEEIEAVQKLVEVAQAGGRREELVESYELLADRLVEAGRYARAREIHRRILEVDPSHRHSTDQLLILEGLEGSPEAEAADAGEDRAGDSAAIEYIDLGQLIREGEVQRTADPRMRVDAQPTGDEQADLQTIIHAFRRGVEENIEETDFESHYDLGVAFREMGLLDEAIREFQLAARGRDRRERAFELMGLCFSEKGLPGVALNCFRRGIESAADSHEALGLHYNLARTLEELGDPAAAREEYSKVVALDVRFLDAAERLKGLG